MKSGSPTLEGFRVILRHPAFGLAEIAWRWSFGAACWLALAYFAVEYLQTLPVTNSDLLLLRTRQPTLIAEAIAHIFRGSGLRLLEALMVLTSGLAVGWIVLGSFARGATIRALFSYFREGENSSDVQRSKLRVHSIAGLNFFRVALTVAATVGCLAALLLGAAVSPATNPAPGSAFLLFLSVILLVWLIWSVMNWFLSLAAVFVVVEGQDTFGAIASAVALCRRRAGSVLAAGTWFGLGHIAAFVLATSLVAFPLGLAGFLPAGVVLGGVLCVTLLYFAVADFLYMGRLAAYVAILELPETPMTIQPAAPLLPMSTPGVREPSSSVDRDELILGDLPSQA
jgi:hypothetical protein